MDNQVIQTKPQDQADDAFGRLDFLFSQIPDHVYDWLFSEQAAANVAALATRFALSEIQTVQLARLTGLAILKDMSLSAMTLELKKSLVLDDTLTRQLAIATAQVQFLPIRDHLVGVEDFIRQLGGSLPATLPPILKPARTISGAAADEKISASAPTPTSAVVQKTLRQLAQENKDSLNQNLTTRPIKIADFDQPVRPTIKNWLVDYVKIKGAGHHESLERIDYMFNTPNAKDLSKEERALVTAILSAYDNDSPLPVRESNQAVLLEKLTETASPNTAPGGDLPKDGSSAKYREPVSPEDMAGPLKQAPPAKPAPRLSGNIIDLKDLE